MRKEAASNSVHNNKCKLSIVLPCYNEEQNTERIPSELIDELERIGEPFQIVAVDDGSTDNTLKKLKELQKKYTEIRVIKHDKNRGLGAAIKTAMQHVIGDLTVTLDSDFTFHPNQIKNLLERFNHGDVDCVLGSPGLAGYGKDIPVHRIVISKIGGMIFNLVLGKRITAITPIFRLYKTIHLKELNLETEGFGINAEILAKLLIKKRRIVEIPATLTTRIYGESKLNSYKEIKRQLLLAFRILRWRISGISK